MISCTEFIPMYSELFKYLHKLNEKKEVEKYWEYVSDKYVEPLLGKALDEHGIKGCWVYWNKSLNEEACDFTMGFDGKDGVFTNVIRGCPSKGMLNKLSYTNPYPDYCEHCGILYEKVVKKRDYTYKKDFSRVSEAICDCIITDPNVCTCDNLSVRVKINNYIKTLNFDEMSNGIHTLDDGDYVNIVEYQTKTPTEIIFEKHRQYIDGFYMLSGVENIYLSKSASETIKEYSSDKDVELAKCEKYTSRLLEAGELTVLDTDVYHCPSLATNKPQNVRKAIFKIKK